jgi:hypothetical protein
MTPADDPRPRVDPAEMSDACRLTPSLSEIAALCSRAARGGGFAWGAAEEIGQSVTWLEARGLNGCDLLLQRLKASAMSAPRPQPGRWPCESRQCPLQAGIALADRALLEDGPGGGPLTLGNLAFPGLVLPFLALSARLGGRALAVRAGGIGIGVTPDGTLRALEGAARFCALPLADIDLMPDAGGQSESADAPRPPRRPAMSLRTWQRLDEWALRTTVPATDLSRSGAGADLDDND